MSLPDYFPYNNRNGVYCLFALRTGHLGDGNADNTSDNK